VRQAALQLAQAARALRIEHGWTIEEVAERSDLEPRHVQLVESGKSNPTLATLLRLARGLGTPLESLVAGLSGMGQRREPPHGRPEASPAAGGSTACAHHVKVARLARGWSQADLAKRVGLSVGAIQGLELGKKSPTVRTLDAIAEALGVQTWTLLVPRTASGTPSRTRVSRRVIE
jgi:transcriptional regulator with XRE-family HTH domain